MFLDLDLTLKWVQIAAYVAVPVLVALIGYRVNRAIATQNIARDYVGLGLGILKEKRSLENANLHIWAIKVLQTYSPIPFSEAAKEEILANRLPGTPGGVSQAANLVLTSDGRIVSRDADGSISIWDAGTGQKIAKLQG